MQQQLIQSFTSNNLQKIQSLVRQRGANVNQFNVNGLPLLLVAIQKDNLPMVELLLRLGADPTLKSKSGMSAILFAVSSGSLSMVQFVVEHMGGDPSDKIRFGANTIILAASRSLDMVRYLESKGADLFSRDRIGYNILVYAVKGEKVDVLQYCIEKGVEVDAKSNSGETVLGYAVGREPPNLEIIRVLVQNGSDPNVLIDDENILIRFLKECLQRDSDLITKDDFEIIKVLVERGGADITAKSDEGRDVLFLSRQIAEECDDAGQGYINNIIEYFETLYREFKRQQIQLNKFITGQKQLDISKFSLFTIKQAIQRLRPGLALQGRTKQQLTTMIQQIKKQRLQQLKQQKQQQVSLTDPITQQWLINPVLASDGNVYNRESVQEMLRVMGMRYQGHQLVPNYPRGIGGHFIQSFQTIQGLYPRDPEMALQLIRIRQLAIRNQQQQANGL
jgi:ankyrin repeat protein/DNA-binding transcriptional MerR regulator